MSKRRVVVTGLGIVSPFGVGIDKFWNSLLEGKSGISTIENIPLDGHTVHIAGEVKDFKPEEYLDPKEARIIEPQHIQIGTLLERKIRKRVRT